MAGYANRTYRIDGKIASRSRQGDRFAIIPRMTDQSDAHLSRRRPRLTATVTDLDVDRQRALLVGVVKSADQRDAGEESLAELELLTDTAGSDPVESILLKRDRIDAGTFIGKGQLHHGV